MRSVVVVLPASICAMMPILRVRCRGVLRATECVSFRVSFSFQLRTGMEKKPGFLTESFFLYLLEAGGNRATHRSNDHNPKRQVAPLFNASAANWLLALGKHIRLVYCDLAVCCP